MGVCVPKTNETDGFLPMKENKKSMNTPLFDEELEIFGEHKTREQVRAEEKARRKEEREALKKEIQRRRQEAKEGKIPTRRKDIIVVSAVLVGIVLLCVLALANSFRRDKESKEWLINEARGHFVKTNASPEMSGEGPKADVSEAYFTNNGHLCVKMIISNGTDHVLRVDALDVKAYDYATDEMLAGGKTELEEELTIMVAGTETYTFYIAPEHILVDEKTSLPELVSFWINIDHSPVEVE